MLKYLLSRWKQLSPTRKLYFVVGTMAVLITSELVILKFAMRQVSAVRAFIEGEALWSKSQKNALLELKKFYATGEERDYQAFLNALSVPEGDDLARLELLKPKPDMSVVRLGFIQGRIHPDDIDGMVGLLRRFYRISYVSEAIQHWGAGATLLEELKLEAANLHAAVNAGNKDEARLISEKIDDLNVQLTSVEDRFSRALSNGSRWLESSVLTIFLLMVLLVEATGLTLTIITGREIAAIAAENSKLFHQAEQSLRTRDEFLSVASHELKTPLTSLNLQLHLLKTMARSPTLVSNPEQVIKLTDQILGSSRRLSTLLDELLDLTRIRVGKIEIHKQMCNLTSIVQDSVTQLGAEAARQGSEIAVQASGAVAGMFDATRVSQVVVNLISNAIKYGEGKPISVEVTKVGEGGKVIVRDQGRGIAEDQLPKLFQRFERFEKDPSTPGLGLGLYISQEIIKAHGGRLTAESRLGAGSVFTVEIF